LPDFRLHVDVNEGAEEGFYPPMLKFIVSDSGEIFVAGVEFHKDIRPEIQRENLLGAGTIAFNPDAATNDNLLHISQWHSTGYGIKTSEEVTEKIKPIILNSFDEFEKAKLIDPTFLVR